MSSYCRERRETSLRVDMNNGMRALSVLLTSLSTFIWGPIEPQLPLSRPMHWATPIVDKVLTRDGEIDCVSNAAMMYLVGHVEDTTGPCWGASPG